MYTMGDFVAANCTSDASHPPASLTWFINDEKVEILIKINPDAYSYIANFLVGWTFKMQI